MVRIIFSSFFCIFSFRFFFYLIIRSKNRNTLLCYFKEEILDFARFVLNRINLL